MGTKNNPSRFDCYVAAEPDEEMFILLGRDKLAAPLVELWAFIREREGEAPAKVKEARECAQRLREYAKAKGKLVPSLEEMLTLVARTRL